MRERIHLILSAIVAMATKASASIISLEQKLEILARCGLRLQPPFTVDDLLKAWDRKDFEKSGFDLALVSLGMTEEKEFHWYILSSRRLKFRQLR